MVEPKHLVSLNIPFKDLIKENVLVRWEKLWMTRKSSPKSEASMVFEKAVKFDLFGLPFMIVM